ncbi:MAG: hypothetical protein P4L27_05505 [Ignavibacteriaceae bacterium]|nr:hypothetical protein [Ignavibacteriaceae bacterium]
MKRCIVLVLFLLSGINSLILSQSLLDRFQGIPIIPNNWNSQDQSFYNYSYFDSVADGIIGFTGTENVYYNQFIHNTNLKVIPYNAYGSHITIAKYSDGAYSNWDIINSRYSNDSLAIIKNNDICTTAIDPQMNKAVLKTNNSAVAGPLLCVGPGIMQQIYYSVEPGKKNYTRTDSLKIKLNPAYIGTVPAISRDSTVVCILHTVYKTKNGKGWQEHPIGKPKEVKVYQFLGYDKWIAVTSGYDLSEVSKLGSGNNGNMQFVPQIDFRIEWKKVDYLNLFVNSITVWDERGYLVIKNDSIRTVIKKIALNNEEPQFSHNSLNNNIIAYQTVDEPSCIDNFAVINEIDKLLNDASGGKIRLFMSIANTWNGKLGNELVGEEPNYKVDEILARTNLAFPSLNAYLFNCPYTRDMDTNYKKLNIERLIISLDRFNLIHKPFFLGIQNGFWIKPNDVHLHETPTQEQFLYNINIGLLYGAKGFVPMNYFAFISKKNNVTTDSVSGYFDPANNHYSPLYYFTKNVIKPRLNGYFGRTLKILTQAMQYPDINFNTTDIYNFITSIGFGSLNSYGNNIRPGYDLGFFTGQTDVKYFMLVRRWYQTDYNLPVLIRYDLSSAGYNNYKLYNYNDSTYSYKSSIDTIHISVNPGDGRLFSLAPVAKYGGNILYNETIFGTNTLTGPMTIKSGATLIISGTYNVQSDISVEIGGALTTQEGSIINLQNGARILVTGDQ